MSAGRGTSQQAARGWLAALVIGTAVWVVIGAVLLSQCEAMWP